MAVVLPKMLGQGGEPHSPSLSSDSSQSPGISSAWEPWLQDCQGEGVLRDCAPHPCLISQPASYANQPTSQAMPRPATVAQGSRGKGKVSHSAAESGMLLLFTNQRSFEIRAWESVS